MDLNPRVSGEYEFLDAGDFARLERFGDIVLSRPSPQALWRREAGEAWSRADGVYMRGERNEGNWTFSRKPPRDWSIEWGGLRFRLKPTGFGHTGLFPEHACHWDWIEERVRATPQCRVLNLFAYTGAMSLVCARAGAQVCHVDAVKDMNDWARENAAASGLSDAPIRWLADDALKFTAREARRENSYHGFILDPPSYGRGPKGEKWILEEHLPQLIDQVIKIAHKTPAFLLFSCHNPGFSPPLMRNILAPWVARFGGTVEAGTMTLTHPDRRCVLPAGFFCRWRP